MLFILYWVQYLEGVIIVNQKSQVLTATFFFEVLLAKIQIYRKDIIKLRSRKTTVFRNLS